MSKLNYVLVNADILPDVYRKVLEAKEYLASGDAQSATQAAKMAGISRSAYYKYKDSVFEYNPENSEEIETLSLTLVDTKGVLSAVVNEIFLVDANVLSINQDVPQNGVAKVSLTMRIAEMTVSVEELIEKLKKVNGVKAVNR
ncbi:MAG: ACT domain-containing protein [Clostridiales bacterium]|nr:ACT domain-containing protein [Clostridiales bacterium]